MIRTFEELLTQGLGEREAFATAVENTSHTDHRAWLIKRRAERV